MHIKTGKPMFVYRERKQLKRLMARLSVELQERFGRILFIDTINSLNPHDPVYRGPGQEQLLKNIYCVRTPKHYDLWARLLASDSFIRRNRIRALLINSLSLVFEDAEENEVNPVMRRIIKLIKELTQKHRLAAIIGYSPHRSITVMQANATINANKGADA